MISYVWTTVDALQVHERDASFRSQINSLEMICRVYNGVQRTMQAVERPLIQSKLDAVGDALQNGLLVCKHSI